MDVKGRSRFVGRGDHVLLRRGDRLLGEGDRGCEGAITFCLPTVFRFALSEITQVTL